MEMEDKEDGRFLSIRLVANTVAHMLIAINMYAIWYFALTFLNKELQLHIIFSATGYQFLMMEGILTFNRGNVWSRSLPRQYKKNVHLILQVLGAIFVLVGFSLVVSIKTTHFTSAHGICGLIGFVCSMISLINGTLTYFAPRLANVRSTPVKAMHTICGCVAIVMGLVTLSIGVNKSIFVLLSGKGVSVCVTVFIAFTLAYALINPLINLGVYVKNMKTTAL